MKKYNNSNGTVLHRNTAVLSFQCWSPQASLIYQLASNHLLLCHVSYYLVPTCTRTYTHTRTHTHTHAHAFLVLVYILKIYSPKITTCLLGKTPGVSPFEGDKPKDKGELCHSGWKQRQEKIPPLGKPPQMTIIVITAIIKGMPKIFLSKQGAHNFCTGL